MQVMTEKDCRVKNKTDTVAEKQNYELWAQEETISIVNLFDIFIYRWIVTFLMCSIN